MKKKWTKVLIILIVILISVTGIVVSQVRNMKKQELQYEINQTHSALEQIIFHSHRYLDNPSIEDSADIVLELSNIQMAAGRIHTQFQTLPVGLSLEILEFVDQMNGLLSSLGADAQTACIETICCAAEDFVAVLGNDAAITSDVFSAGMVEFVNKLGSISLESNITAIPKDITEIVIDMLLSEITFAANDVLTFSDNGYLVSIDIKSKETSEMLFQCIRNCRSITDLTGAALAPEKLPILINGKEIGRFERIYSEYPETGQFFSFNFTEEDTAVFYEYVMALKD